MPLCRIDGVQYSVSQGSVLDAVLQCGLYVPHLCHVPGRRHPQASCDLCFVEVVGMSDPVRACECAVREGMEIGLSSERAAELSRTAFRLIMSDHRLDCPSCVRGGKGSCELKVIARFLGVSLKGEIDLGDAHGNSPAAYGVKQPAQGIAVDHARCVLCARCVEACVAMGTSLLGLNGRGASAYVGFFDPDSAYARFCAGCLKCVEACPVGALSLMDGGCGAST